MERSFAETTLNEGRKEGYESALNVLDELNRHELLEEGVSVDFDRENIIEEVEWQK